MGIRQGSTIGSMTHDELAKFVKNIQNSALPVGGAMYNDLEVLDTLVVDDQIQLSPQALSYLSKNLTLTPLEDLVVASDGPWRGLEPSFDQFYAPPGHKVTFPTSMGNNSVVEPSFLYDARAPFFADANGNNGYEYVFCADGYYQTIDTYENPNLWVSHDGETWIYCVCSNYINGVAQTVQPADGLFGRPNSFASLTPVVQTGVQGDGLMSDSCLVQGPDGMFYIIWNQFLVPPSATTATGVNAVNSATVNVGSTASYWNNNGGNFLLEGVLVPFTGVTATSFTGCGNHPATVGGEPIGGTAPGGMTWAIKGVSAPSLAGPWSAPVTLVTTNHTTTTRPSSPSPVWVPSQNKWQVYCTDLLKTAAGTVARYDVSGTNLLGTWAVQTPPSITIPTTYGVTVTDASMTSGSAALNSVTANFTPAMVGWSVRVYGAGAAGADLQTTISAYVGTTQVTLAANAGTNVTNATAGMGYTWWHLNAYRIGKQLVILMQDSAAGTSGSGNLWLLFSRDEGATWTVPPRPLMQGLTATATTPAVGFYRGAMVPTMTSNGLALDIYYGTAYSGASPNDYWQFNRTTATGTLNRYASPAEGASHAMATAAAVNSIAPFLVGDVPNRADNTSGLGNTDSPQTPSGAVNPWVAYANNFEVKGRTFIPHLDANNNKVAAFPYKVSDGQIVSGNKTITSASSNFQPHMIGWSVQFVGAGAGGAVLTSTIMSIVSPTSITIADAAGTSVASGGTVMAGPSDYVVAGELISLPANTTSREMALMARVMSTNDFIQFGVSYNDNATILPGHTYSVLQFVGGVQSARTSFNVRALPGDVLMMVLRGPNVDCYVNGGKLGSVTYTRGMYTGVGLKSNSTSARMRNVYMRALVQGY